MRTPCSRRPRMWARNAWLAPAESQRIRMSLPCRCASGICASAWSSTVMWSAAVFDPALPGAQHAGQGFAGGVEEAQQRVVAERLLPGLGRRLLLRVADHDRGVHVEHQPGDRRTRPPSRTAAGRSRPPAPTPPPAPAPGRPAAGPAPRRRSPASTRHAVGSEATAPNSSGWLRSTARSAIASPPSASITARSTATRPGSCPDRRCRNGASASRHRRRQAGRVGQIGQQPGAGMTDHATPVRRDNDLRTRGSTLHPASALRLDGRNLRQVPSSQVEGHFYVYGTLRPARATE